VGQSAKKVWCAIGVAVNQTATEEIVARRTFSVVGFGHQPNMPINHGYFFSYTHELLCFYDRLINQPSGQINHVTCHIIFLTSPWHGGPA
jgi:hypothetical protein